MTCSAYDHQPFTGIEMVDFRAKLWFSSGDLTNRVVGCCYPAGTWYQNRCIQNKTGHRQYHASLVPVWPEAAIHIQG